jgi:hypothetical protein
MDEKRRVNAGIPSLSEEKANLIIKDQKSNRLRPTEDVQDMLLASRLID